MNKNMTGRDLIHRNLGINKDKKTRIAFEMLRINAESSFKYVTEELENAIVQDAVVANNSLNSTLKDFIELPRSICDINTSDVDKTEEVLKDLVYNKLDYERKINKGNFFRYSDIQLPVHSGFQGPYTEEQKLISNSLAVFDTLFETLSKEIIELIGGIIGSANFRMASNTVEADYYALQDQIYSFSNSYQRFFDVRDNSEQKKVEELFINSSSVIELINIVTSYTPYITKSFIENKVKTYNTVRELVNQLSIAMETNPEIITIFTKSNITMYLSTFIEITNSLTICVIEAIKAITNIKKVIDVV